jgi:hypothetical protein
MWVFIGQTSECHFPSKSCVPRGVTEQSVEGFCVRNKHFNFNVTLVLKCLRSVLMVLQTFFIHLNVADIDKGYMFMNKHVICNADQYTDASHHCPLDMWTHVSGGSLLVNSFCFLSYEMPQYTSSALISLL